MYKAAYTITCLLCSVLIHHYFFMPDMSQDIDVLEAHILQRPLVMFSKVVVDLYHGGRARAMLENLEGDDARRQDRTHPPRKHKRNAKLKTPDVTPPPPPKDDVNRDGDNKSNIKPPDVQPPPPAPTLLPKDAGKLDNDAKSTTKAKLSKDVAEELRHFQAYIELNIFPKRELTLMKEYFTEHYDHERGYLMLAIADSNYADFCANFAVRTKQLNLKVAFVCLDDEVQLTLARQGHTCHVVKLLDGHLNTGDMGNVHGPNYIAITNLKTLFTAVALFSGFDTLYTDVDVSLFRDPAPFLKRSSEVDAYITDDTQMSNSGFGIVYASQVSKLWYARTWMKFKESTSARQQVIWNEIMHNLEETHNLSAVHLDAEMFPCGDFYFRQDRREFYGARNFACEECVAVHNNYAGTPQAKRYRMRETGLWLLPRPGPASSPPRPRYLKMHMDWSYDQPSTDVSLLQRRALTLALRLAARLRRVLVLPRFRCCEYEPRSPGLMRRCANTLAECSLLHVLDVQTLEEHIGEHGYRESTFSTSDLSFSKTLRAQDIDDDATALSAIEVLHVKWVMDRLAPVYKVKGEVDDLSDEKYSTSSYEQFRDNKIFK